MSNLQANNFLSFPGLAKTFSVFTFSSFICCLTSGLSALLLLVLSASVSAAVLPQFDNNKHLGVASCASSVCHGKGKPVDNENVWLNEYRIWSTQDRHSRAYKTLRSEDSRRIAKNLGLDNAQQAKICLDCHADNLAKEKRGPKFQIKDGVGCEACHGGSEQWIESHTEEGVTHEDNLAKGMYPTEDGVARAKLCLSCHLGTNDKLTTHKIMGAGHPRLTFELETFTANQPAHYAIDDDYRRRKGEFSGFNMWLVGQVETAKATLALMKEYLVKRGNRELVPELYFYDCHACHHPMSDIRWTPTSARAGMPPGVIRLNDVSFLMLLEATNVFAPQRSRVLRETLVNLHLASVKSRSELKKALVDMSAVLEAIEPQLTRSSYTVKQSKQMRSRLLSQAAAGEYRDFSAAEQAFLAIESITLALQQSEELDPQLNALYDTLSDQDKFSPGTFKSVAGRVKDGFD